MTESMFCVVGADNRCTQCERLYTHSKVSAKCKKGVKPEPQASGNPAKKRRPRTAQQIEAVLFTCIRCEHHIEGMCALLRRTGCGSCKSAADFASKVKRGAGCPDKPARFPATEFVESERH